MGDLLCGMAQLFNESLAFLVCGMCLLELVIGHGTMMTPIPRQPESMYWYQVGCMIGCTCSGDGKESYPSLADVKCTTPGSATLSKDTELTWNAKGKSPMGDWNQYMPWR